MISTAMHLDKFYEQQGFGASNFKCRYAADCEQSCAGHKRYGPYASGVGKGYEYLQLGQAYPKLAFLSLAPANKGNLESENAEECQRWMNDETLQRRQNNPHWRQTKDHAFAILGSYIPDLSPDTAAQYFCNINAAKCREANHKTKDPPKELFINCRTNVLAEINFLKPDVLIVQGLQGWNTLEHGLLGDTHLSFLSEWDLSSNPVSSDLRSKISYRIPISPPPEGAVTYQGLKCTNGQIITYNSDVTLVRLPDGHTCLVLWTYHPASSWIYRRQLEVKGLRPINYYDFNRFVHPLIVQSYWDLLIKIWND